MKYKYEPHLHTWPASRCGKASVSETLRFYKDAGYTGVFLTNHFVGGNIGCDWDLPATDQLSFYFRDYYEALEIGKALGIDVFCGIELSFQGTDVLIYGLEPDFFFDHPEFFTLGPLEKLSFVKDAGAFLVQAHPFREESYIPCIRLLPRDVHAVETFNACNNDHENHMATLYAKEYGLPEVAGSDNHRAGGNKRYGGIETETRFESSADYKKAVLSGETEIFVWETGLQA